MVSDGGWNRLYAADAHVPDEELSDQDRVRLGLPQTLRTIPGHGLAQRPLFEPALKQFSNAYRAGDPQFADPELAARWKQARQAAVGHVLAAIAASAWVDHLVLRGSVLLRAWYGQAAREPGDLDFVVIPQDWRIEDARTEEMLDVIAHDAERAAAGSDVRVIAGGAVSDEIWTYDRVPGRRLLLPWEAEGLPGGWVQLDFVFNESLPLAPETVSIPDPSRGTAVRLWGASAELSLAWKVQWLVTDMHPQGKDLYDAVLLAECTPLRYEVLRVVFEHGDGSFDANPIRPTHISSLRTEWKHFRAEYPDQPDSDEELRRRLLAALEPTFTMIGGRPATEYESRVAWLEPQIARYRSILAEHGLNAVHEAMVAAGMPVLSGIVIIRELLGREQVDLDSARSLVAQHPAWTDHISFRFGDGGALAVSLKAMGVDVTTNGRPASPETRLARRVRKDFTRPGEAQHVLGLLADLARTSNDPELGTERVLAAIVLVAAGDFDGLQRAIRLARANRHDVLRAAGLAGDDWPQQLDERMPHRAGNFWPA